MISIIANKVYNSGLHVGDINLFCCGTDFRIHKYPKAIFSILGTKTKTEALYKSIEIILTLKIPNKKFHWNFDPKIAYDDLKLKKYQEELKNIK